jgi:preprotein translocase subunit SecE
MAFLGKLKDNFSSSFSFFSDSWSELKKVKWPNRKELTSYTIVVVSVVIFVTIYFAFLDLIISQLVRLVSK